MLGSSWENDRDQRLLYTKPYKQFPSYATYQVRSKLLMVHSSDPGVYFVKLENLYLPLANIIIIVTCCLTLVQLTIFNDKVNLTCLRLLSSTCNN